MSEAEMEGPGPRSFVVCGPQGERELDIYTEEGFQALVDLWTRSNWQHRVSYEVTWMGIPIIQLPGDILMMQELLYKVRPDVVIESGTAHGGTAMLYASILKLLERGRVISIDVEIRKYNRLAIQAHPLSDRIQLVEGSSVDEETLGRVKALLRPGDRVLVCLDSNHTEAHVRAELEAYASLVSEGSYMVVFDTILDAVADAPQFRPEWKAGTPAGAVRDFLAGHPEFQVDREYNRLGVTYCAGGFLRKVGA